MFAMFCTGVFLWIVYGFLVGDLPVLVANFVTFLLAATILGLKRSPSLILSSCQRHLHTVLARQSTLPHSFRLT